MKPDKPTKSRVLSKRESRREASRRKPERNLRREPGESATVAPPEWGVKSRKSKTRN